MFKRLFCWFTGRRLLVALIYPDGGRSYYSDREDARIARAEIVQDYDYSLDELQIVEEVI